MRFRQRSIAFTIVAALALGLLIPLSVGFFYSLVVERSRFEQEQQRYHTTMVDSLAHSVEDALLAFAPNEAENAAKVLIQDPRVLRITIHSAIYGMFLTTMDKPFRLKKTDVATLRRTVTVDGTVLGYVEITIDRGMFFSNLTQERGDILLLFCCILLTGLALVIPVLYLRLLRPVARLTRQAETLSSGRLDVAFEWKGNDELSRLGRTFEEMRGKLLASFTRIQELAVTDDLTGLPNRRAFFTEAGKALDMSQRYGRPLALAMIDIDHFKDVNDTHGHAIGDLVLQAFAAILAGQTRKSDILARYGGEEFMLCMPETGLPEALQAAEKLRAGIEAHSFPHHLSITSSFGVALLEPSQSLEALLEHADHALYTAKRLGRNRVVAFGQEYSNVPADW